MTALSDKLRRQAHLEGATKAALFLDAAEAIEALYAEGGRLLALIESRDQRDQRDFWRKVNRKEAQRLR